jgi:acetylornithine/N-succinyldiaminopimelate aminotransferase
VTSPSDTVAQGLDRLLPTYARADVTIVRGDGPRVWDADGAEYLDFGAGIAVVGLGHCHPAPLAAAREQLDLLWHASNLYRTGPAEALAARLSDRFGGAQAFFCNSGAEAVEAALKYARKATGKPGVVALEGSFHGRTLGALSATGQPSKRAAFSPLVPGVRFVPPNDVEALLAAATPDVGLVLLEAILGEGGVHALEPDFVAAAAELPETLLCLDEIQTGVGRTGSFFAFEALGTRPDLVTLAKGLANGLPIGALLVADHAAGAFSPGDHGSTFGGNPVACAAACAVVDAVDDELLANVVERGAELREGLRALPGVRDVRGRGLLLGGVVAVPASDVVDACRERGLLVLAAGEEVVRLAPPLTIGADEVEEALSIIAAALAESQEAAAT